MGNKKDKRNKTATREDISENSKKMQLRIRKEEHIRALQSKHISLVVGPSEKVFVVPEGLLRRHSPFFEKMLNQPFKESIERLIRLPEVDELIFGEFLVWLYDHNPCIAPDTDMETLIGLAVFADFHLVYTLKNQLPDLIRAALHENPEELTPENLQVVYHGTPMNSTLRRLCSCAFALRSRKMELSDRDDLEIWKQVFTEFGDFGWDYFQSLMEYQVVEMTTGPFSSAFRVQEASIMSGGSCRFHDHSEISGWKWTDISECPYPHGVLELPDPTKFKSEFATTPNEPYEIVQDRNSNEVSYNNELDEIPM